MTKWRIAASGPVIGRQVYTGAPVCLEVVALRYEGGWDNCPAVLDLIQAGHPIWGGFYQAISADTAAIGSGYAWEGWE